MYLVPGVPETYSLMLTTSSKVIILFHSFIHLIGQWRNQSSSIMIRDCMFIGRENKSKPWWNYRSLMCNDTMSLFRSDLSSPLTITFWSTEPTGGFPVNVWDVPDLGLSLTSSPPLAAFCYHVFWHKKKKKIVFAFTLEPVLPWTGLSCSLSSVLFFTHLTVKGERWGGNIRMEEGLEELEKEKNEEAGRMLKRRLVRL